MLPSAASLASSESVRSYDVLSDVLRWARLRGVVQGRMELSAPWGLQIPPDDVAVFYVVTQGACWMEGEGLPRPLRITAGDLVFVPRRLAHTFKDAPRTRARSLEELFGDCLPNADRVGRAGGGGAITAFIGGCFLMEGPGAARLLQSLPPVIHVPARSRLGQGLALAQGQVCLEVDAPGPGSGLLMDRLADVLLVQVLRHYMRRPGPRARNWLTALLDPHVGRALSLMHAHPERGWTVSALAHEAGVSRSGFAARFRAAVGQSPIDYLARWRVEVAADLLVRETLTVGEAAARVGYGTDAAFARVFKRHIGLPPAQYRRRQTRAAGASTS